MFTFIDTTLISLSGAMICNCNKFVVCLESSFGLTLHRECRTSSLVGHLTICSGPEVIKHFSCSTQLSMKFILLIKLLTIANSFFLNVVEHEN